MARTTNFTKLVVLSSTMCLAQRHMASRYVEDPAFTGMEFHLPRSFPCASLSRSRGRAAAPALSNVVIVMMQLN